MFREVFILFSEAVCWRGAHRQGRFGSDAVNQSGNIRVSRPPLVHSDGSWFWMGAAVDSPHRRRGLRLRPADFNKAKIIHVFQAAPTFHNK